MAIGCEYAMEKQNPNQLRTNTYRDPRAHEKINRHQACPRCHRTLDRCLCSKVSIFENRIPVVILQHPQEQFKKLNSAWLAGIMLEKCRVMVGFSWQNFKSVTGPAEEPSKWGVLYLKENRSSGNSPVTLLDKKGNPLSDISLRGIIALDGSWRQAKTLWWRNPWLLRCNRIVLNPRSPSLRSQVKQAGLSTIEAVACALEYLGEDVAVSNALRVCYQKFIIER
jgi:hypothetical protein